MQKLKILHVSNDYPYTNVYPSIFKGLYNLGCESQIVYVPMRKAKEVPKTSYDESNWKVVYSSDYGFWGRFFMSNRLNCGVNNIKNRIDIKNYDLIHAHYLYTGGGIARILKKEFNLPYVCTVRGTDINFYMEMPHLKKLGFSILLESNAVSFLSPSQREFFFSKFGSEYNCDQIYKKSQIISNGISGEWITNIGSVKKNIVNKRIKLLYVGELTKNKNWKSVINVNQMLNEDGFCSELTIAGDGPDRNRLIDMIQNDSNVKYLGHISDFNNILGIYRDSDIFVMPSFSESFGLAYLEAISQGLPLIYARNQGIDGFYPDKYIGIAVDPGSTQMIKDAICEIFKNLEYMSKNCIEAVYDFSWDIVVEKYYKMYENGLLNCKN